MNKKEAKNRIEELRKQVEYHAKRYYDDDEPEISDFEYDMLMVELRNLEKKFPEFNSKESLTQKVGGHVKEGFEKVTHEVPLQSLQDVFSIDEVKEYVQKIEEKAIFEKVTGDAKVEIQQSMIDREADQLAEEYKQKLSMQGFSWDQAVEAQGYDNIMNSLKEDAAMRVKNSLVIDKIAKEENLVVSQAEFGAKLSEIGRMYQMDTPTMIKQLSQTPGVFNAISQQALNEKVTQFLAENNTVKFK